MAFVGRRLEMERLAQRLAKAAGGHGCVVLISGEPGVGKTSLGREVAGRAAAQGVAVRRAACFEGEWQAPYQVWSELGAPALGDAPPLAPGEERHRLFEATARWLLDLAAGKPLVVAIEDLQWADPDSLALFRRIARGAASAPLLLLATHRSGAEAAPLDDLLAHLAREADVERITLAGLSREEVHEYLAAEAGTAVPGALATAIHRETLGNPFFVREVLSHLVEEHKIARRDGRWTTEASIAELGIPPGVRHVVRQRVARLSPETRGLLELGAAFTTGVEPEVLAAVAGREEAAVLAGLDEGVAAGLLRPLDGRRTRYDFAHAIVRHAIYEDLGAAARRDLHRRAAAALAALQPTAATVAELAAQHYRAGSPEGLSACLAAAEQARLAHASTQAVRYLRMAAELAGEPPDPALTARLAIAEAEALLLDDAAASAAAALEGLVRASTAASDVLAFVVTIARLLKEAGAPPPAWEPLVRRGMELVGERRDLAWARLVLLLSPMAPLSEGEVHVGRWLGHDAAACTIALRDGDEADQARTVEAWDWRTPAEVEAVLERARAWAQPAGIVRAYEMANRTYLFRHGDLGRAEQLIQELLALGRQWGSPAAQGEALTQLALCHAYHGRLDEAARELAEARAVVEPLGALHRQRFAVTVSHPALIAYLGGEADWPAWGRIATATLSQQRLARAAPLGLILAALGGLSYAMAGDAEAARGLLEPLTTLLERAGVRDYGATGATSMAVAACWQLHDASLVVRHTALCDRYEEAGLAAGPFTSWALPRARLAALAGNGDRAARLFAQAQDELGRAGHRALAAMAADDARGAAAPVAEPDGPLTAREREVLTLIARGHTTQEIAARIHVSVPTVNRHIANVYLKIGARNRASATAYALSHGLA